MTEDGLCGGGVIAYPDDSWFRGDSQPKAVFDGVTGPVELWEVPDEYPTNRYLIFAIGSWRVGIPDGAACRTTDEHRNTWAQQLDGQETQDGFLILRATDPIRLIQDVGQAPALWFGPGPELEISLEGCDGFVGEDRVSGNPVDRSGGQTSWCLLDEGVVVRAFGNDDFVDLALRTLDVETQTD